MTAELSPKPATKSSTSDPTPDTFPYAEGEPGLPLPGAAARGILAAAGTDGSREPVPASDSRRCPDCNGDLVNGAGLFACGDCDWYGSLR